MQPEPTPSLEPVGPLALFLTFSRVSLSGFGGVLPFIYRAMVERSKWLNDAEFAELLAIAQILPGPSVCNLSGMVGYRKAGLAGAAAATAGMVLAPMLIIVVVAALYTRSSDVPAVRHALAGMSAVAAGLLLATSLKLARALPREWSYAVFGVLTFIGIAVLHWPLIANIACVAPVSIWLAWRKVNG